jgi:hypothetical protein
MTTKETSLKNFHPKMASKINISHSANLLLISLKRIYRKITLAKVTSFEPPPVKAENASYTLSVPCMRLI